MSDKPVSVRIPAEQSLALGIIARAEGVSISEVLRAALDDYASRKWADDGFHKRLDRTLEEERQMIESVREARR